MLALFYLRLYQTSRVEGCIFGKQEPILNFRGYVDFVFDVLSNCFKPFWVQKLAQEKETAARGKKGTLCPEWERSREKANV